MKFVISAYYLFSYIFNHTPNNLLYNKILFYNELLRFHDRIAASNLT
jgi:hypothetical protein